MLDRRPDLLERRAPVLVESISGFHPNDEGLVRWTLYRCGHVRTDVAPDGVLATDEGQLSTL